MYMHAEFTSTSELPFASLQRVLVLNVSHDFHVHSHDFHAKERTGDIYFHTNSFATEAKVNLGLGYSSMSCSGSL